jgi:RHS repeat-associated protein
MAELPSCSTKIGHHPRIGGGKIALCSGWRRVWLTPRVARRICRDGGVTSYAYDLDGNLTSITDPDSNVTSYAYNAANEMTSMTNPMGYTTTYDYDAVGLLTSTTDADGRTIDYGYNADGLETTETWVGGNYTATFAYNADSEMTSASDPNSSYSYGYNALGEQTSVSEGIAGVITVALSYAYDSFGNVTNLTDSLGGSITYSYNGDNEMTGMGLSVSGTLDALLTFSYDGDGNMTGITRTAPATSESQTITSTYGYNQADELTNITDATATMTLASYTYGYNADGDVTSYQDNGGNSMAYNYDAADQLTSATGTLAGSNYTFTYNYDKNGNRTSTSTDINSNLTSATDTTTSGNELLSDGTYSYAYDNEGNLTSQTDTAVGSQDFGDVTSYSYDFENRLTAVTVENSQGQMLEEETFTYDVFGNRIGSLQTIMSNGTQQTQQLYTIYNGSNPYMDFAPVNGTVQLTERYLTNPNGLNQFYGQVNASGTTEWYLTDNINSIRQVINAAGTSLDAITYDPFGSIITQTNAADAPRFGFAGGAADSITGNDQFDFRNYSPVDGRWTSQDPLGFVAEDPNLYGYVFNAPTENIDPSGLWDLINDLKPVPGEGGDLIGQVNRMPLNGGPPLMAGSLGVYGNGNQNAFQAMGAAGQQIQQMCRMPITVMGFIPGPVGVVGRGIGHVMDGITGQPVEMILPFPLRFQIPVEPSGGIFPQSPAAPNAPRLPRGPRPAGNPNNPGLPRGSGTGGNPPPSLQGPAAPNAPFLPRGPGTAGNPPPSLGSLDNVPPGWNRTWTWGPPSGAAGGGWRWFDPNGGEWRWHAPDSWHPTGHWDWNPWDSWNSPWQNVWVVY